MRSDPPDPADISHIEAWVFDLDNTLYHPSVCDLFPEMDERMNGFIAELLDIPIELANERRRDWWERHGNTLSGLIREHGIDPVSFLDHVHDLDLDGLALNATLDDVLQRLPGRKIIFTNATEAHAVRVTERLGIRHHFEAVFDVVGADYLAKPDPSTYRRFLDRHAIDPKRSVMFEDMAKNLKPAAELGMTTVWVRTDRPNAQPLPDDSHVDYATDDLVEWLTAVAPVGPVETTGDEVAPPR